MFRLSSKGPVGKEVAGGDGTHEIDSSADNPQSLQAGSHAGPQEKLTDTASGDRLKPTSSATAPETAPPLKPFSKKGTHMPTKPTAPQNFRNDIPRRVLDIPGAQRKSPGEEAIDTAGENKLVVGKEISLSGAISACECLVVEGEVSADLPEAKTILVSKGGVFKGSAHVQKAEISGVFEGDLIVKDLAVIKPGGVIKGSVTYVNMIMEKGSFIDGTMVPTKRRTAPVMAKIADAETISSEDKHES